MEPQLKFFWGREYFALQWYGISFKSYCQKFNFFKSWEFKFPLALSHWLIIRKTGISDPLCTSFVDVKDNNSKKFLAWMLVFAQPLALGGYRRKFLGIREKWSVCCPLVTNLQPSNTWSSVGTWYTQNTALKTCILLPKSCRGKDSLCRT